MGKLKIHLNENKIVFVNESFLSHFERKLSDVMLKNITDIGFNLFGSGIRDGEKIFFIDSKSKKTAWVFVKRV